MSLFSLAAVIDISTINCLRKHGFHSTADLLDRFAKWWKIMSVKTPRKGIMQRDEFCDPIVSSSDWKLSYLEEFVKFLCEWKATCRSNERRCLSVPTMEAILQTTSGVIDLARHLLSQNEWNYLLTGKLLSDPIERRYVIVCFSVSSSFNTNGSVRFRKFIVRLKLISSRSTATTSISRYFGNKTGHSQS